ncbi:ATP-binding protein [Marinoscillum sp.]|uniref:tetratricopeptide repeat-containing hybrid sensor histidine kinase/response regulator n=1 Tax=Marinoscillum sp. TaxID=2024838 RepID=UPI003BA9CC2D
MYSTDLQQAKKVLNLLANADLDHDDPEDGIRFAKKAVLMSIKTDDSGLLAISKYKLSQKFMQNGEVGKATTVGREVIGTYQVLGDDQGLADSKFHVARIYLQSENYHLGLIYLLDCLEIYRRLADYHHQAKVQMALGTVYEFFKDDRNAIVAYEKSIDAAKKVGDVVLETDAYNPLSGIYLNKGQLDKAEALIERSMRMKHRVNDMKGMAYALYGKGKVYVRQKNYLKAKEAYLEAIRLHRENGELLGLGKCYYKLGVLYYELGEVEEAVEALRGALNFANFNNLIGIKSRSNYLLYEIYKERDDYQTALQFIEAYMKEKETLIDNQTQKVINSYESIATMERMQKEAEMQREKAEIIEKKNKAEQASKVKQDFLSTMSHEIRTPLNAVTTITSFLQETAREDQVNLLESLQFSSNNLLRIINDILDFNKLDAGKLKLDLSSIKIRVLLENIRNTYLSLAKEKGVDLLLRMDNQLSSHYLLDETRLTQVLGNLVSNAIKFTDNGSVTIEVELMDNKGVRDKLQFSVTDTGSGVPVDFMDQLFESFSQPQFHKTKKHGGSGLGLAIVKKIIELHQSDIHVESKVGEGSRFYFELELTPTSQKDKEIELVRQALNNKSVLLAEDNMINAMVSMKLLGKWGLKSIHATNGEEVVRMAGEESYDCILMDIHMPQMDGFEAAQRIRTTSNPNQNTPIFALTADVMAGQESFSKLFNGFLLKPIEQDKLYAALASV